LDIFMRSKIIQIMFKPKPRFLILNLDFLIQNPYLKSEIRIKTGFEFEIRISIRIQVFC
jgi:hypothetical protein